MSDNDNKNDAADSGDKGTGQSADRFVNNLARAADYYREVMHSYLMKSNPVEQGEQLQDQMHVSAAFMEMFANMFSDPQQLWKMQVGMLDDYWSLYQMTARRMMGEEVEPVAEPDPRDRRFRDPAWQENPGFDFIKQFYLMASKRMTEAVKTVDGMDEKTSKKVSFYTQQFIDALSPSNFLMTNPEALREMLESEGENLVRGMEHMLHDVASGSISMSDVEAFNVGENIACTPGKVVFENDLMQLIQYSPTTDKVFERPLLVIPAWINKFYILDLRPENSYVKWLVEQGYTVFMISWVNPTEAHRDNDFSDYVKKGPLAALDAIEKATGQKKTSCVGYCLGGTLLSITLAHLADTGKASRVASATYFTTMLDFTDAGDISVFIDDEQITNMEKRMSEKGFLEGKDMAMTFNMLRSNDLIWHFYVNNYLLGKGAFPFDLLYWNSDATRMPAKMHSFYLRNMYQRNKLAQPGGVTVAGTPIDLTTIKTPAYMVSTREDHIAPWESTYKGTQLFQGPVKFVLAASGHVAGIINPPVKKKYNYWTNDTNPASSEEWVKNAEEQEGSWWPDWAKWHKKHSGKKIPARTPGDAKLKVLEDAPGSFVKSRV